ncbi:MAG: hypothetical protein JNM85_05125 [Chthonomonas sp.]|nr:hypothetical protein [Chthonomonas sp.]
MNLSKTSLMWSSALGMAILGSTALATQAIARQEAGNAGGSPVAAKGRVTGPVAARKSKAPAVNSVLMLLNQAIVSRQNSDIEYADTEAQKEKVIQACNRAIFALLPEENHEDQRRLIQVEAFAPDKSVWREIEQTKSLVKALIKVSPEVDQSANASIKRVWDRLLSPDHADRQAHARSRPAATKERQFRAWVDSLWESEMNRTYHLLTNEQQAEWDAVMDVYKRYSH